MLDDLLGAILGEAAFGRLGRSRQARLIARLFFGCLGAGLSLIGLVVMARRSTTNPAMHLSMLAMFGSFGSFWLFNVGMGRRWKWPAIGVAISFILMFVTRIVLGP